MGADSANSIVVSMSDLRLLYCDAEVPAAREAQQGILARLGPLAPLFAAFVADQRTLVPPSRRELMQLFAECLNPTASPAHLLAVLRRLAPGNGQIGYREVNALTDLLREHVHSHLRTMGAALDLPAHDHAFGSGGDFWKTGHATTHAAIVVAPLLRICKTGTVNVTARHGSYHAIQEIGYNADGLDAHDLTRRLVDHGFAFLSLAALGFPYGEALRVARRMLWAEAVDVITKAVHRSGVTWREAITTSRIPLDIFKIISPNAQVLNPVHHSTGVYHMSLIPYVLGIYLHLGTRGVIVHCYDGIDELSNASLAAQPGDRCNLVIKVEQERVIIAEFSPEDLGFRTARLQDIEETDRVEDDACTFWEILSGARRGPACDFVVANAAALLVAGNAVPVGSGADADVVAQLRAGSRLAEWLIDSGVAYDNCTRLVSQKNAG